MIMELAYIIYSNSPTGSVMGHAKEVLLLQMSMDYGREMMY
jgi:hypothetical protein